MISDDPWADISIPQDDLLIAEQSAVAQFIYYAIDQNGCRHFLVQLEGFYSSEETFRTRALIARIEQLEPRYAPSGFWLDVSCTDEDYFSVFGVICQQFVSLLESDSILARDRLDSVTSILTRWHRFWSSQSTQLSERAALGLLGSSGYESVDRFASRVWCGGEDHWGTGMIM